MIEAAQFCDIYGVKMKLVEPRDKYIHGWGQDCHDGRPIVCTWELNVTDKKGRACTFYFDLVNGNSPLVMGLDVGRFCDTVHLTDNPHIRMHRPGDDRAHIFSTYIAPDSSDNPGCIRVRIELMPRPIHDRSPTITTLLSKLLSKAHTDPRGFAHRIHRYTHAHPNQLKAICESSGVMSQELEDAIDDVCSACDLCTGSGRPHHTRKVSLSHVNEAFNQEIQVDFTFLIVFRPTSMHTDDYRREKYTILVLTDTGTRYTEACVVPERSAATITHVYDQYWLCRHGASKFLSADDEYNRHTLTRYLNSHGVEFKARPTRRHNKLGIVERKNGTLKEIIIRLARERSTASINTLVARGTFLCNMFAGSQMLSAFQLARGYQSSLLGLPPSFVTQELLDAHTHQVATRALQKTLRSRTPNIPTPGMFQAGDTVWVWYATSQQNQDDRWIKAIVVNTHRHYMEVRRIKNGLPCKGPTMKPAYEDVRVAPQHELTQKLMECTLETALEYDEPAERGVDIPDSNTEEVPQNTRSALMSAKQPRIERKKDASNDIGEYSNNDTEKATEMCTTLTSSKARILEEMYEQVGSQQMSRGKLDFAPPWILDEAFDTEYNSNWIDAFKLVDQEDIPHNANVITSHTVYKIKTDETNTRKLKARIVPHGNHDDDKDRIRKDSATAQLNVIRLLLSIVTVLGLRLASADIKGAYLQSGPITRDIYVRPPPEWYNRHGRKRGQLWKLTKLPYGIVEAGRQWLKTVEEWMLGDGGLENVFGLSQLFVKRNRHGSIILIVAKVTDDFLVGGQLKHVHEFLHKMRMRLEVGKIGVDGKLTFNGCEIVQDEVSNIHMSIARYMDRLKPITISRQRKKQRDRRVNDYEIRQYRALAGTLLFLGNGVLPQASFVVSIMQQRIGNLSVQHLVDANSMLKELIQLNPCITFRKPHHTSTAIYCTLSDASHPKDRDYGQSGIIAGLRFENDHKSDVVFHAIDWTSHKQTRVSYSSYGAEILAAADGDDRGFYFKSAIRSIFPESHIKHELIVDSQALYDTITTLHQGKEYRLRPTVQRIRNSFESNELDTLRWLPGKLNIADALTKRSMELSIRINQICSQGYLDLNLQVGYAVDSVLWK